MFDLPEVSPSTVEFIKSAAEEISFEKLSAAQIRQRREAGKSRRRGMAAGTPASRASARAAAGGRRGGGPLARAGAWVASDVRSSGRKSTSPTKNQRRARLAMAGGLLAGSAGLAAYGIAGTNRPRGIPIPRQ
jgi:hypothetical protein